MDHNPNSDENQSLANNAAPERTIDENSSPRASVIQPSSSTVYRGPIDAPIEKKSHKTLILVLVAGMVILIGLLATAFGLSSYYKKMAQSSSNTPAIKNNKADKDGSIEAESKKAPVGYKSYSTKCYTINIPEKYSISNGDNNSLYDCQLEGSFTDGDAKVNVKITTWRKLMDAKAYGGYSHSASCSHPETTIATNVQRIDGVCAIDVNEYEYEYLLSGSNTKLGNYQGSSSSTTIITVRSIDANKAGALAGDLYKNISAP